MRKGVIVCLTCFLLCFSFVTFVCGEEFLGVDTYEVGVEDRVSLGGCSVYLDSVSMDNNVGLMAKFIGAGVINTVYEGETEKILGNKMEDYCMRIRVNSVDLENEIASIDLLDIGDSVSAGDAGDAKCTDSDGPKNFNEKGSAYGRHSGEDGIETKEWVDYCMTDKIVYDFTCEANENSYADSLDVRADTTVCANGCENGACVGGDGFAVCVDSDGGLNILEAGEAEISGVGGQGIFVTIMRLVRIR